MEKQELIAVALISVSVIVASKKIQQLRIPSDNPLTKQSQLQVEALTPSLKTKSGVVKNHPSHLSSVEHLDLGVALEMPTLSAPVRHFELSQLKMMLQSQVIVEPFVEKFTLAAPVFYIDAQAKEHSVTTLDPKGRVVLFL